MHRQNRFGLRFFGFDVLWGLRGFSNSVFGFRFLSTVMAVFRIFLSNAFYSLSGFVKEVTPFSFVKTLIPKDHLYSLLLKLSFLAMYDKPSLFNLAAVIWVVTAAKHTMKS